MGACQLVSAVLGISNTPDAVSRLDSDEKMTIGLTDSHSGQRGGAQSLTAIVPAITTLNAELLRDACGQSFVNQAGGTRPSLRRSREGVEGLDERDLLRGREFHAATPWRRTSI
jgi:hypothetical protein